MVRQIFLNKNLLAFLGLITLIVTVFNRLTKTFYQQDEWIGLGLVFSKGINSVFPGSFRGIDLLFVKGRMLSSFIFYLFASYLPFQNTPIALLAIILHTVASSLVFLLIKKLVKKPLLAFLGAAFFALNSVSHGAITWSVIAINTVSSTIIILISILAFFRYVESNRTKWLVLTGILLYTSLWFKETGLYLFVFFPLAAFLFKPRRITTFVKQFWWFLVPFVSIVGYRVLELRRISTTANLYLTGANDNFFLTIFMRLIIYPLTSFSLMFVPGGYFLELAREVLRDNYTFFASSANNILIAQSVILDLLAVILTGFILTLICLFLRNETPQNFKKVMFWLAFILISFSPYVVLSKDFSYLESRYYYLPVVGAAVLFSWVLERAKATLGNKVFFPVVLPLVLIFIFFHAITIKKAIDEQVLFSNLRLNFISNIKNLVPTLSNNKNVFYITSDKNYWVDTNMLPFQQGSGYTLMVLYFDSGKIPQSFLTDGYLFEIGSQGYREAGGLGFGFFYDKKELEKAMETYKLSEVDIIYLNYNYKAGKITVSK